MRKSQFIEIVHLMRLHQLRSRFVEEAFQTGLSLVEAYVLLELSINSEATVTRLAWLINVDEAAVARAIRRLMKAKQIGREVHADDHRRRRYSVLARGKEALEQFALNSKLFLDRHLPGLTILDIADFQRFCRDVCDFAGAAPVTLRPGEHPFEEPIRRMTRALGFVGSSIFGSGHSSTTWQVLSSVAYSPAGLTLSILQGQLGIHVSTLSQICTRFEKQGWIRRVQSTSDARMKCFTLTARGRKALDHIEGSGVSIFERAFEKKPAHEARRYIEVFRKYLGQTRTSKGVVLRKSLTVERVTSEVERRSARGFLIFHLTRLARYLDAAEVLVGSHTTTLVIQKGDVLVALLEVGVNAGEATAIHHVFSEEGADPELLADFLEVARTLLFEEFGMPALHVPRKLLLEGTLGALKTDSVVDGDTVIIRHA